MINKVSKIYHIIKLLGILWVFKRIFYIFKKKSKYFTYTLPIYEKQSLILPTELKAHYNARLNVDCAFFFTSQTIKCNNNLLKKLDSESANPFDEVTKLLNGKVKYFGSKYHKLGMPIKWYLNPSTKKIQKHQTHWSTIDDFNEGDIKFVWEASRFSFVFALVRAFSRDGHEKHGETFWKLIDSWILECPPQVGVHWKCGQEISFRSFSWIFGFFAFINTQASTEKRIRNFVETINLSAIRIEKNINYALSQNNNHGVSESVALFTIGLIFPELPGSKRWVRKGNKLIIKQLKELVYEDGLFSQHSINYHRVLMHDLLWCIRIAESNKYNLNSIYYEKLLKLTFWLEEKISNKKGNTPNFGSNDGANIFPITNCQYSDYRPIVETCKTFFGLNTPNLKWKQYHEEYFWFNGSKNHNTFQYIPDHLRGDKILEYTAYKRLNGDNSHLFIWAPKNFKHRPAQSDLLHADIWYKGTNVAIDPGTYSYNGGPNWDNSLVSTKVHNTVRINTQDQMDKIGKFLLIPWPKTNVVVNKHYYDRRIQHLEIESDAYKRINKSIIQRRSILKLFYDSWIIVDYIVSEYDFDWEVNWLFPYLSKFKLKQSPLNNQLICASTSKKMIWKFCSNSPVKKHNVIEAGKSSNVGWYSPFYGVLEKANHLNFQLTNKNKYFITAFCNSNMKLICSDHKIECEYPNRRISFEISRSVKKNEQSVKKIITDG
jgi:hypothetical protein